MRDKPAKILFLSHSADWGGAQKCLYLLLRGLDSQKYKPLVVLPGAGSLQDKLKALNVETRLMRLEWAIGSTESDVYQFTRFKSNLGERVKAIVRLIQQEKIELVFTNTTTLLEGALAARICGVRHVWHIHEMLSIDPKLFPVLDPAEYYALMNTLTDVMIVVSKAVQAEIEQFIQTDKIEIIHNTGFEALDKAIVSDKHKVLGLDPHHPVICYAGFLSKRKGVVSLVDSASVVVQRFPRVKFVIVGPDDGVLEEMQRQVKEKKLEHVFHFLGFRTDIFDIIASADVIVLPSLSDPMPLVVLEAMTIGKPVVATRSGGAAEMIVDGETGFLVPVGDPAAMAQAILTLLDSPQKMEQMGWQGKHRVETAFSYEQYISNFERVFEQVLLSRCPEPGVALQESVDTLISELEARALSKVKLQKQSELPEPATPSAEQIALPSDYRDYEIKPTGRFAPYRLSVCIPTYNGAGYLVEAISSVLKQTCQDFELVIVDDCSTDSTDAIAKSFAGSQIKYFRNPAHLGLVGNWNRCLELSTGEFVYVFHQDNVMLPDNVAQKYKILAENPQVGLVYSNVQIINAAGAVTAGEWFVRTEPARDFIMPGLDFFEILLSGSNLISCPSVMVRRACYERLGGFDTRLPFTADWEMWARIALFYDVAYLAEPLIKYRYHGGNESRNFNGLTQMDQYFRARMYALEKYPERLPNYQELKRHVLDQTEKKALDWVFHYHHSQQYDLARQAVAKALTLHASAQALEKGWTDTCTRWYLDTVEQMCWGSPSRPSRSLLHTLSGEDVARQIPIRTLIKAVGFKIAAKPGFRWLYRYRELGRKILGG